MREKTLKAYLKHLRKNIEFRCMLAGSEDFEREEFYIIGPGSKREQERLRKTNASYLDPFDLIDFVLNRYGDEAIHAEVRRLSDKKIHILSLDYLKVKPGNSRNFSLIDDYGV